MTFNNKGTIAHHNVWNTVFAYAQRYPNMYSALVLPIAILGYACLLFFPFMLLAGTAEIIQLVSNTPISQMSDYIGSIVFWLGVMAVCAFTTFDIISIKFQPLEGIDVTPAIASNLHQLIEKSALQVDIPKIDRIIITEQLSIDIAKTPAFPLPVWSTNTLVVGLPLMQCLSPEYFECAVTRKLIQYSKNTHTVSKWLYQMRNTWAMYAKYFSSPDHNNFFLSAFFGIYAPVYRHVSVPVANHVELLADQDTLAIINDEDLLQTIEKVIVTKIYLEKQYWPKIQNLVSRNLYRHIEPYSRLEQALEKGLTPKLSKQWLDSLYCSHSTKVFPVPDLRSRMNNIGRSRIRIPEKTTETAAHYYLDNAYRDIISEVNQLWLVRSNHQYESTLKTGKPKCPSPLSAPTPSISSELFN